MISEFISSVRDIIKFVNDRAFECVGRVVADIDRKNVENLLAFLDSAEIFLEIGAGFVGGEPVRWVVIGILQTLKYVMEFCRISRRCRTVFVPLTRCGTSPGSGSKARARE